MSADLYVSATLEIKDVEDGFDAMVKRVRSLRPIFNALKKPMREDQRDHGKRQRGPIGAWARRSSNTLEFYRTHGRKRIPRPGGKLTTSVQYTADGNSVTAESRVPWSSAQQDGGVVGRGVRLKARPFLWLSSRLLDHATTTFERAILEAFGGK